MNPKFRKYFLCFFPWCTWGIIKEFLPPEISTECSWVGGITGILFLIGCIGIFDATSDKLLRILVAFPVVILFFATIIFLFGLASTEMFFLFGFAIHFLIFFLILLAIMLFKINRVKKLPGFTVGIVCFGILPPLLGSVLDEQNFLFPIITSQLTNRIWCALLCHVVPVVILGLYLRYCAKPKSVPAQSHENSANGFSE